MAILTTSEEFVSTVKRVAETLSERAAEVDKAAAFPAENLQLLRSSGLLGMTVPEPHGGLGATLADTVYVGRVLAGGCLSTAFLWAMHCQQVDAINRFGQPTLQDRVLPEVAKGTVYVASITTEIGKGGYLLSATSALQKEGDDFFVDRHSPIVTGGEHADGFLITARSDESSAESAVSLVYIEADDATRQSSGEWWPMGMRGTHSVAMRLRGSVRPDQVVGEPGKFRDVALESMIPVGHLVWSACWLGAAERCLEDVVNLARSSRRPRGLDPHSDLVTHRLGRVRLGLELVNAYLGSTLSLVTDCREHGRPLRDRPIQIQLNTLKVAAAENSFDAVNSLIQLCGLGIGYIDGTNLPLERVFRDLRAARLTYSDDRLLTSMGTLTLADRGRGMIGSTPWTER